MSFDVYYPQTPWDHDTHELANWYDPVLKEIYVREAVYGRFVTTQFDLANARARQITIENIIPPDADSTEKDPYQLWYENSYIDSYAQEITMSNYNGKLSLHSEDDIVTYWRRNGQIGLVPIIQQALGQMVVDTLDKAARLKFFENPFSLYGDSTGTDFSDVGSTDKLTTALIEQIWLELRERDMLYNSLHVPDGTSSLFCLTTDGVIADIRREASTSGEDAFIPAMRYADPSRIVRGEIGEWRGVRFVGRKLAKLHNAGAIGKQATITAAVNSGDGAPDPKTTKVRGVYKIGQPNRVGIKYYVQVDDVVGFAKGDIVSIHRLRTNDFGITNGLDYRDGRAVERRIFSVDTVNKRLVFEKPIMMDFATDLGSGVYGYVTKAAHIHSALFINGNDGVAMGIARPPVIMTPPAVDDGLEIQRFTWKARLGYQLHKPESFVPVFVTGSNGR